MNIKSKYCFERALNVFCKSLVLGVCNYGKKERFYRVFKKSDYKNVWSNLNIKRIFMLGAVIQFKNPSLLA